MSEVYSDDAPLEPGHQQLQAGQRLSQARFVLQSELFRTSESSVYWLAQDRDEDSEVILYFPSRSILQRYFFIGGFVTTIDRMAGFHRAIMAYDSRISILIQNLTHSS